ncbi:hypothetical protein BUALT_Bualt07G0020200 [Buddleja alternifolia]|uniref:Uncharacterized protein n=1 Tax=Buddleja alternifolia TaxID=168488 RepID=A0AAV6X6M7_9LAMI|nr:hypothetical protein BUALT_Bualt07G0020200 [Buddleja alternifolia]
MAHIDRDYLDDIQEKLDAPMPWIGMYIAAASAICTLAMLTLDLTGIMRGRDDNIMKVSSLVLMSSAMCNSMTSLASMDSKEIFSNLTALAILVITFAVNVCEAELPKFIFRNICEEVDKLIQKGRRKKPKNLVRLLHMSRNFDGVIKFDDNKEVPSLHSQEPPNCWSLPVVTLTSIAVALPNIAKHKFSELLSGVREGLYFVKLIEKSVDGMENLRASEMQQMRYG